MKDPTGKFRRYRVVCLRVEVPAGEKCALSPTGSHQSCRVPPGRRNPSLRMVWRLQRVAGGAARRLQKRSEAAFGDLVADRVFTRSCFVEYVEQKPHLPAGEETTRNNAAFDEVFFRPRVSV